MNVERKPIGGFFELELPKKGSLYHDAAIALANGRVCFKVILNRVKPTKVYIPFYCCDMLIQPLKELKIPYDFYRINAQLDPVGIPLLGDTELFVYVNYFGLKTASCRKLSKLFGDQIVIDNTQAFFEKSLGLTWSFNSCRKFFGVPDGGFLYSPLYLEDAYVPKKPIITDHLWLSFSGRREEAFDTFQQSEAVQTSKQCGMSDLTRRILYGVDFPNVMRTRRRNYKLLDRALRFQNLMPAVVLDLEQSAIPFCYPLLLNHSVKKTDLYAQSIYLPTLWTEVLSRDTEGYDLERLLVNNLLLLPLDHRVDETDIQRMVRSILEI